MRMSLCFSDLLLKIGFGMFIFDREIDKDENHEKLNKIEFLGQLFQIFSVLNFECQFYFNGFYMTKTLLSLNVPLVKLVNHAINVFK